jgi:hypothetical protein
MVHILTWHSSRNYTLKPGHAEKKEQFLQNDYDASPIDFTRI